jgi:hypothetical protein
VPLPPLKETRRKLFAFDAKIALQHCGIPGCSSLIALAPTTLRIGTFIAPDFNTLEMCRR